MGEFSQRRSPSAGDGEVGDSIGQIHAVAKCGDVLGEHGVLGVNIPRLFVIGGTGDVQHLNANGLKLVERHADDAVDASGPLASPHDEEGLELGVEIKEGVGIFSRLRRHV